MSPDARVKRLFGEAVVKHAMIEKNDRILVAFSGGKDSYAMLSLLLELQKKAPVKYSIFAVTIDAGYDSDYSQAENYLKELNVDLLIKRTRLKQVVMDKMGDQKNSGNYCFLCSRLRRGILYKTAIENKCTKIALGHNFDDAIETFLMNSFYISRLDILEPKYTSDDGKNTIIRPLIYIPEEDIIRFSEQRKFPIVKQKCLLKKSDSKRDLFKKLIKSMSSENRSLHSSLRNVLDEISRLKLGR